MDPTLTIFWPEFTPPDIEEIRFSYDFCRAFSREHANHLPFSIAWEAYHGTPSLGEIIPRVKGELVLCVSEPEIVLSPGALRQLVAGCQQGYWACGPVYNESAYPHQIAALAAPYVDMDTFLEVAENLEQQENLRYEVVDALHPACILFRLDFLRTLDPSLPLAHLPGKGLKGGKGNAAVSMGGLVHIGFYKGLETERPDLVRLIPPGIKRILDVGCARGGYGRLVKRLRPEIRVTGLEMNPDMAAQAQPHYHEVLIGPVEDVPITEQFDMINCGDILEHLKDPWGVLKQINALLRTGGCLVLSIPNAGHWSMVRTLLKGEFQYIPLGLTCIGHLRWFTESSMRRALEGVGFCIDVWERQQILPTPSGEKFIQEMVAAGYGDEASLRTNEFIVRAVKQPPPESV